MNVELTRFKVKEGKSRKVDEWLKFLNKNMEDVLVTLDGERMYIESILRECCEDGDFLYWFSVQGEGGADVEESTHWIDKKHMQYWDECIDPMYKPVDMKTEVVMIPEKIRRHMG